ncbi:MAG: DUF5837 family cyanobactin class RiPP [Crocosphaera sp.]
MNKKNITPNPQQPVDRVTTGKLPNLLAELEEASLSGTEILTSKQCWLCRESVDVLICSYDGEDE